MLEIYDKHYNKWFMSKQGFKIWKMEEKAYKLKVRMLKRNALNEYSDVELCGEVDFGRKDVCRIVEDSKILNVVGKMRGVP